MCSLLLVFWLVLILVYIPVLVFFGVEKCYNDARVFSTHYTGYNTHYSTQY